jgi:hypothetical protein
MQSNKNLEVKLTNPIFNFTEGKIEIFKNATKIDFCQLFTGLAFIRCGFLVSGICLHLLLNNVQYLVFSLIIFNNIFEE